jgi:hypothetical protein
VRCATDRKNGRGKATHGYCSIARRMGRVVPDKDHSGMWRSVKVDGILSDTANLCWSKDNVMAQAIREIAWNAANDPKKCPVKRGSREQKSPPMRLNAA